MLLHFKNKETKTFFAPTWDIYFYNSNIEDPVIVNSMRDHILDVESDIISRYSSTHNDGGTALGPNSLTSKFSKFNIFTWREHYFQRFQDFIRTEHSKFRDELNLKEEQLWIGCWANVLRAGQSIAPHWHNSSETTYLGAHMCLSDPGTSTIYVNPYRPHALFNPHNRDTWIEDSVVEFENKPGELLFFPDWMIHYTTPYTGTGTRVTIAMDIVPQGEKDKDNEIYKNYVKFN